MAACLYLFCTTNREKKMATSTKPTPRKFSELRAEATKDVQVTEPYVLEFGEDDQVSITAPTELERTVGLAQLISLDGVFDHADSRRILELFCGEEAFPRIWTAFRREHTKVMIELINELIVHFKDDIERDRAAVDAPGGSGSSPS